MHASGRYRFRRGWLGYRVLQSEWVDASTTAWRDEDKGSQREDNIFAIATPRDINDLRARVAEADRRADRQRRARALKRAAESGFGE